MAFRGNGTLRADPRVSSSAKNVEYAFSFSLFSLFTFPFIKWDISRSRDSFAHAQGSLKGCEGNASSLTSDAIEGKGEKERETYELLEEPRSPSYEKNSQMLSTHIINQAYTSERHASRRLSKKSNVESCKEFRSITLITRSATSERWARGMSGNRGTVNGKWYRSYLDATVRTKQPRRTREVNKQKWT